MFTGIIETTGSVLSINPTSDSSRITFSAPVVLSDAAIGASIAVNGVCLTVTEFDSDNFSADLMHETLKRSSLGNLTRVIGSISSEQCRCRVVSVVT